MAYYHARSGVCRSGVTHAGLVNANVTATVGGTVRTSGILVDQFRISRSLDGRPSVCHGRMKGFTPSLGQTIYITRATPDEYLFGGTILRLVCQAQKGRPVEWDFEAVDFQWQMDRYERVNARYRGLGVGSIVARILSSCTDGGFVLGECPSTLGTITDILFTNELVSDALRTVAKQVGAYVLVDFEKHVHIRTNFNDGNSLTLSNSSDQRHIVYQEDMTQARNKVTVEGGGPQALSATSAGATSILVNETGWLDASSGGGLRYEEDLLTYTGASVSSGEGTITASGLGVDIPEAGNIYVRETVEDATAQSDMATTLGGGLSGVIHHVATDGRLDATSAAGLAATLLSFFKDPMKEIDYETSNRQTSVGKTVAVSISDPITISATFILQQVDISAFGIISGTSANLKWVAHGSKWMPSLPALLATSHGGSR